VVVLRENVTILRFTPWEWLRCNHARPWFPLSAVLLRARGAMWAEGDGGGHAGCGEREVCGSSLPVSNLFCQLYGSLSFDSIYWIYYNCQLWQLWQSVFKSI